MTIHRKQTAPLELTYHNVYAVFMSKNQLGIAKKDLKESRLAGVRKELAILLKSDQLGYGAMNNADIAVVLGWTRASVSRVVRFGKNVSR